MNVSWEVVGILITTVGGIVAGILAYRQGSKKDAAETETARQRMLLEREQALIKRYEDQLNEIQKELQEEKVTRRACETHILEIERQMAALQRQVDKLTGNGGKHE